MRKRTPSMPPATPPAGVVGRPSAISPKRWEILLAMHKAGRTHSAHSTVYYSTVATRLGLALSDLRVWDLLYYRGVPMSAGQVGDVIGLTQGAVTGILKRLERVGAISSEPDPSDRRKVVVRVLNSFREGQSAEYFEEVQSRIRAMYGMFSDEELQVILRFQQGMASLLQMESLELRANSEALMRLDEVAGSAKSSRRTAKKR